MNLKLRLLSIIVTLGFVGTIIRLLKTGRLKENFSLIWISFSVFVILIAANFNIVRKLALLCGFDDPNNAFFFFGMMFLALSILVASIEISCLYKHVTKLIQQVSILNENAKAGKDETDNSSTQA